MAYTYNEAWEFAKKAHGAQRYGDEPYAAHLLATVRVLCNAGHQNLDLQVAAILHDTIEDTAATEEEVRRLFGNRVATLVLAVTRRKDEGGKEALERYYARIKAVPDATLIKLCDRIANVHACLSGPVPEMLAKYRERYPKFRGALYVPGQHEELWAKLDAAIAQDPGPPGFRLEPPCVVCGKMASKIVVFGYGDSWVLDNEGPGGSGYVEISRAEAEVTFAAFTPPHTAVKIRGAGHYDNAGFCLDCEEFYCYEHWDVSVGGYGHCPKGHGKSLDPHWSPDSYD